jgi:hypothetical protein
MSILNIEPGTYIKDIPCVCKAKNQLFYSGHDKEELHVDCHHCFARFYVNEISEEVIIKAIDEKKAQLKVAQLKKEKRGKGKKNKDVDEEEVAIEEDDIEEDEE